MPLHSLKEKMVKSTLKLGSKAVSTHRTGTHPEQPLPTSYNGIPFIVGFAGVCSRGVLQFSWIGSLQFVHCGPLIVTY